MKSIISINATFLNSVLINNTSIGNNINYGGCFFNQISSSSKFNDSVLFNNCSLINNSIKSVESYSTAGCTYLYCKNITIINCNFINNSVHSNSTIRSIAKGGALYLCRTRLAYLDNCYFYNNTSNSLFDQTSESEAGGIYFDYTTTCNITIFNCNFDNNSTLSFKYSNGGAIKFDCFIEAWKEDILNSIIFNCTFQNNTALPVQFIQKLISNSLYGCIGAVYSKIDSTNLIGFDVQSCLFENNKYIGSSLNASFSGIKGCGMYIFNSKIIINNCVFRNYSAFDKSSEIENPIISGVALHLFRIKHHVISCIFENNNVYSDFPKKLKNGYGIAIYALFCNGENYCLVEDCKFVNNCFNTDNYIEICDLKFYRTISIVTNCEFNIYNKNLYNLRYKSNTLNNRQFLIFERKNFIIKFYFENIFHKLQKFRR